MTVMCEYVCFDIDNEGDSMRVLNEAQEMLRHDHGISRSTIQIEMYDANIMNSCDNCQRLDA